MDCVTLFHGLIKVARLSQVITGAWSQAYCMAGCSNIPNMFATTPLSGRHRISSREIATYPVGRPVIISQSSNIPVTSKLRTEIAHNMSTMVSNDLSRIMKFTSRLSKNWGFSLAIYGAAAVTVGLYITDWKVTNTKIPYYGKKFDDEGNI
ncbi:hypothetical protein PoB_005978100 [Plakobranchus ocellatus]|uniref:Deltamethrin resistance protein prag01 domain-containing protein n=1 Tax=Plakobranchus ocellatus TaxID=259542 RepID=A0AAV4CK31_9GAST|nr:hypothetical protein PoB_005978100 [Plakobranchus ocellatus]